MESKGSELLKVTGNFFLCLLLNIFLNFEGLIPAVILLILHFWLNISFWWSVLAIALWIVRTVLYMLVIGWVSKCGSTADKPKENKNPYSVSNKVHSTQKGECT